MTTASRSSTLAKVAAKNFRNGALNPNAFRRKPISEEDILNSPVLNYPLTQYMFCAPDEGRRGGGDVPGRYRAALHRPSPYTCGQWRSAPAATVPTRSTPPSRRSKRTSLLPCTPPRAAFEKAGVAPEDVDVIQLQDTDAGAEIIHMAECGFCADGDQEKLLADGATEISGAMPVNTDGGLIANGEPIGASGLRQIHELVRQLRGEAGDRQVPGEPRGRVRSALRRARHRRRHDPDDLTVAQRALSAKIRLICRTDYTLGASVTFAVPVSS